MSPRAAMLMGTLVAAVGMCVILAGTGVLPTNSAADAHARPWVIVAAGLVFVFGGAAVIVGYGIAGGIAPDGDLPPGTPFGIRVLQYLLGLGCIASLAAVVTWIAFGAGERRFSGTVSIPFVSRSSGVSASSGRMAFGFGAVALWLILAGFLFTSVRRLLRARSK